VMGAIDFHFTYHGPLGIEIHGTADVSFNGTSVGLSTAFTTDDLGRPVIQLGDVDVQIETLNVHLSGVVGWLIDVLIAIFKPFLISIVQGQIANEMRNVFGSLITAVETNWPQTVSVAKLFNTTSSFVQNVELKTSLIPTIANVPQPEFPFESASPYLIVATEFEFDSTLTSAVPDPRPHQPITNKLPLNPAGQSPMLATSFSESFVGSFLWTLTQNGALNFSIHAEDIPAGVPIQLNTALFQNDWPALTKEYPNHNLSIDFYPESSTQPPEATVSVNGSVWSDVMVMQINVIDPSQLNPVVPVARLQWNVTLPSLLTLLSNSTGIFAGGKISWIHANVTVLWSESPTGNVARNAQGLVTALSNAMLIQPLDNALANGVLLTKAVQVFSLSNLFVSYNDHFATVGLDIGMVAANQPIECDNPAVMAINAFRAPYVLQQVQKQQQEQVQQPRNVRRAHKNIRLTEQQ